MSRPTRLHTRLLRRLAPLRRLRCLIVASFPDALAIVRDRGYAEREQTTPADHDAADALRAIVHLLDALTSLIDSLTRTPPAPPAPDSPPDQNIDF